MPTTPITLTPLGGPPYACVSGHLMMLYRGPWVLDLEISSDSLVTLPLPSGTVAVVFGGVPMAGTVDPASSGMFGPTGRVRVIGGGNGWSKFPKPLPPFHSDAGILSTTVLSAVGTAVGEVVVDGAPKLLGTDFIVSTNNPAMQVFGDDPWYVDPTGITHHGPRLPSIPDASLVVRDYDPITGKVTFSCDSLLIPGTPMVDPTRRFGAQLLTAYNVEQVFDGQGSVGWAWCQTPPLPVPNPNGTLPQPTATVVDELKAATLYWTRAGFLRVYRYRFVITQGEGPGGGPERMALQAVDQTPGIPALLPVQPWSGVAGVVSTLAPSQEVLVVFENADPTLPRVIGYSLVATGGLPLGLPLKTMMDASVELDIGKTCPLVNIGETGLVNIAGGLGALVLAAPYAALLTALTTFAAGINPGNLAAKGTALATALGALPPAATTLTKAT